MDDAVLAGLWRAADEASEEASPAARLARDLIFDSDRQLAFVHGVKSAADEHGFAVEDLSQVACLRLLRRRGGPPSGADIHAAVDGAVADLRSAG